MTPFQQTLLVAAAVSAPWNLALLAGVVVVLRRGRHRLATGLAVAGLLLMLGISVFIMSGFELALRDADILRDALASDGYRAARNAAVEYGGALGLGLVILAAFVGRRVTGPR